MKKILLTITGFFVALLTMAQSPNLLNYQGVARNSVGNVLPSQPVGLRLSILTSVGGSAVYTETRNVTTNAFGLFNVQVGSPGAITTTGTIAGINWTAFGAGSGPKYLQVEIDPIGGTNYFNVGTTQLVSVPYALNAGASAPVGPAGGDLSGTYPNPTVVRIQGRPVAATAPVNLNLLMWDAGTVSWIPATAVQAGIVSGTGTLNTVAKWTPNGTTIGNSQIFDDGTNVGINTTTPVDKLQVNPAGPGGISIGTNPAAGGFTAMFLGVSQQSAGYGRIQAIRSSGSAFGDIVMNEAGGNVGIQTNAPQHKLSVGPTTADAQTVMVRGFGGGPASWKGGAAFGNTNATVIMGELGGVATIGGHNSNLTAWQNLSINPVAGNVGVGTAAPTSKLHVAGNFRLVDGTQANNNLLKSDVNGNASWGTLASIGGVSGTGTLNFVPKWTPNGTTIGNSQIYDNGVQVGIGNTAPQDLLSVGDATVDAQVVTTRSYSGAPASWKGGGAFGFTAASVIMGELGGVASIGGHNTNLSGWADLAINTGGGNVGIGNATPGYKLDVWHGGFTGIRSRSTSSFSVVDIDANNGDEALRLLNNGAGDWHIGGGLFGGLNFYDMKTGQNRMLIQNVTGNVGIGTNAPITRLHVEADAPGGALQTYRNLNNTGFTSSWYLNPAGSLMGHFGYGNPGASLWADQMFAGSVAAVPFVFTTSNQERMRITPAGNVGIGTNAPVSILNILQPNATSGLAAGTTIFAQKGAFLNQYTNATSILATTSATNSIGVGAITNDGFAIVGGTVGTGSAVLGQVFAGTGGIGVRAIGGNPATSYALATSGRVIIQGQGAAAGNVLTSDAVGNATWQAPVKAGISLRTLNGGTTVPNGTETPLLWGNVLYEDGGANYNTGTGEYTVPVAGIYSMDAAILWNSFGSSSSVTRLRLYINGNFETEQFTNGGVGIFFSNQLAFTKKLNAGDKINVTAFQTSGSTQTIGPGYLGNTFSVTLIR